MLSIVYHVAKQWDPWHLYLHGYIVPFSSSSSNLSNSLEYKWCASICTGNLPCKFGHTSGSGTGGPTTSFLPCVADMLRLCPCLPLDMSMVRTDSDMIARQVSLGHTYCLILILVSVWNSHLYDMSVCPLLT